MTEPMADTSASGEPAAFADVHAHPDDRILGCLAVNLGQHDIGDRVDEEALALHRRQLRGVAQHQHLGAVAQQVERQFLADH